MSRFVVCFCRSERRLREIHYAQYYFGRAKNTKRNSANAETLRIHFNSAELVGVFAQFVTFLSYFDRVKIDTRRNLYLPNIKFYKY